MDVHVTVDRIAGALTRRMQRRLAPKENTRELLGHYRDRPLEELFPRCSTTPRTALGRVARVGPFHYRRLRFESFHRPLVSAHHETYRREHGQLHSFVGREIRHAARPARRALVYVHGWAEPGAFVEDLFVGPIFARALDCDVFHFELPHHGRRQLPGSRYNGALFVTADLVRTLEAIRQSVLDARTVLEHVRDLGRYDEVGMAGISLGGAITGIVACAEADLDWAVSLVGHLDIADFVRNAAILDEVRDELARFGIAPEEVDELSRAIALDRLAPAGDPGRLLVVGALSDQFARPEAMRRQLDRWRGVQSMWIPGGHLTSLFRLPAVLAQARDRLGLEPGSRPAAARPRSTRAPAHA